MLTHLEVNVTHIDLEIKRTDKYVTGYVNYDNDGKDFELARIAVTENTSEYIGTYLKSIGMRKQFVSRQQLIGI